MNTFKQAMEDAGLRAVDFRNLMENLTGYRPPHATLSRWMNLEENDYRRLGAYEYALALVNLAAKCPNTTRHLIGK